MQRRPSRILVADMRHTFGFRRSQTKERANGNGHGKSLPSAYVSDGPLIQLTSGILA
jgi:hypothetical protein